MEMAGLSRGDGDGWMVMRSGAPGSINTMQGAMVGRKKEDAANCPSPNVRKLRFVCRTEHGEDSDWHLLRHGSLVKC